MGLPRNFPKNCLKQLFCREPVDGCFCLKELHDRRYLKNFPEHLKHKAEDCSFYTWNLLKGTSLGSSFWKYSNIFKTPVRNLVRSPCLVVLERAGCKYATIDYLKRKEAYSLEMYLRKNSLVYIEVDFPPANLLNNKLLDCYRSVILPTRNI